MPSLSNIRMAGTVAAAMLVAGCAFEDGEPWATAEFALEAEFDESGRLTDGRYRTTKEYEVELDEVSIVVGAMSLSAGAGDVVDFDPSNPPAGYSLCHNGHCHADDGRLVDYDVIAAEVGGGAASTEVTATINSSLDAVSGERTTGSCADACVLPRGAVTRASVVVRSIRLRGTAYDVRDDSRLPEAGVPFDWETPLDITLETPTSAEIGKDFGGDIEAIGGLKVSARLFDAIDFESGLDEAALRIEFTEESLFEAVLTEGE